jgi:hypothetical protein
MTTPMTHDNESPATPAPPRRGRPPKRVTPVSIEPDDPEVSIWKPSTPSIPAGDDPLVHLEAQAQAPIAAAAETGEELRASLAPYAARAKACDDRLAAREADVMARVRRVQALPLRDWRLQLGGHSTLIAHLEAATARLAALFTPRADAVTLADSTRQTLAGIPRRIARLTARDAHACPPPPPCECPVAWIKTLVERAELAAAGLPRDLDAVADLLARIKRARAARADVVVTTLSDLPGRHGVTTTGSAETGADHE